MIQYLHTGVYRLDIRSINSEIAHLYEHLLIRSFDIRVVQAGYAPYLMGWVGGETFRDAMFVDYGLYSAEVELLFREYMTGSSKIEFELLDDELERIAAESRVLLEYTSKDELIACLQDIDSRTWVDLSAETSGGVEHFAVPTPQVRPELLTEHRSKKSYKDITVRWTLSDATLEERTVLLRLLPILLDALSLQFWPMGAYGRATSWPLYSNEAERMAILSIHTVRRSRHTNAAFKRAAEEALRSIDLEAHWDEVEQYKQCFATTPNWHSFPIDYFRYTGIVASKRDIVNLMTLPRMQSVLRKLHVEVVNAQPAHYDVCS
jgi:hypothetical protein